MVFLYLMLNSGKKFALCATKKINNLTLVWSEKKILNETKNHNPPPFKLNGRSLIGYYYSINKWVFSKWTGYMSKVSHIDSRKVV
jgi:hypothetical protein